MRRLSTNENLNEPQPLPDNWGPIFGLHGIIDKLGDLSWLGDPDLVDTGWIDTGIPVPPLPKTGLTKEEEVKLTVKTLLTDSDWSMMPDVPITNREKTAWIEYRKALREIKLQPGYPDNIAWPNKPL